MQKLRISEAFLKRLRLFQILSKKISKGRSDDTHSRLEEIISKNVSNER
jgi:hypothetical protein